MCIFCAVTVKLLLKDIFVFNQMCGCFRSSHPLVFCEKGVLRSFPKLIGKHLCQSFFFNKVAGLRPATLLRKRLWHRRFTVIFVKFLRTPFFVEHLCMTASAAFENISCFLRNVRLLLKDIEKNVRLLLKRKFVQLIFFVIKQMCGCFCKYFSVF